MIEQIIIKRIDEQGRIYIPKHLRKKLNYNTNDLLEITANC